MERDAISWRWQRRLQAFMCRRSMTCYHEDGTLKSFLPNSHAMTTIKKQLVMDFDAHLIRKPVVPFIKVTQDRSCWRSRGVHPRMPFLSGGYGLPPLAGEEP